MALRLASSAASAVGTSVSATTLPAAPADSSFDQRWAAWRAAGAAHDRAVRRKTLIAVPVLVLAAAVFYALLAR